MDKNLLASLVIVALVAVGLMLNPNTAQAGEINTCMRLVRPIDIVAIDAALRTGDEDNFLLLLEETRGDIDFCMKAAGEKTDLLREIYWRTTHNGNGWRTRISRKRYESMISCNYEILAFRSSIDRNIMLMAGPPYAGRSVCRGQ